MNHITSAFFGFIFTLILFFLCLFCVIGFKLVVSYLKSLIKTDKPSPKRQKATAPKKPTNPKNTQTSKSIEINPDEIDRIYVRKSS
ncbi:MAG: hypothetical protein E7369_00255 [Clostridiales bacterium]|nr:hypothetical protein [Clostridiales bacterium]